jgi:hypothetical protein
VLEKPGDRVRPPFEDADRLGYVMACGPVRRELEKVAEDFVSGARVKLSDARTDHPQAQEVVC